MTVVGYGIVKLSFNQKNVLIIGISIATEAQGLDLDTHEPNLQVPSSYKRMNYQFR